MKEPEGSSSAVIADGSAQPAFVRSEFEALRQHIGRQILGQSELVERLLIALLADGHLLVEGAPGLAKTRAVKALASGLEGDFHRIQFTPDLLPADLTGTEIYRPQDSSFRFDKGPVFHNFVLADEVNRAPAKVQSALLEAMEERQITVAGKTYPLPRLFMVLATQNPIEQEGTYPLPDAQMDRFLMKITVDYPQSAAELAIIKLLQAEENQRETTLQVIAQDHIFAARDAIQAMSVAAPVEQYIVDLVMATRSPAPYGAKLAQWIATGSSPRASISLHRASRASAWLDGRDYVTPDDVRAVLHAIMRHRLILTYDALADQVTPDAIIDELIEQVAVG